MDNYSHIEFCSIVLRCLDVRQTLCGMTGDRSIVCICVISHNVSVPLTTFPIVCIISLLVYIDHGVFRRFVSSYHRVDVCARGPKLLGEVVEPNATLTHLERHGAAHVLVMSSYCCQCCRAVRTHPRSFHSRTEFGGPVIYHSFLFPSYPGMHSI